MSLLSMYSPSFACTHSSAASSCKTGNRSYIRRKQLDRTSTPPPPINPFPLSKPPLQNGKHQCNCFYLLLFGEGCFQIWATKIAQNYNLANRRLVNSNNFLFFFSFPLVLTLWFCSKVLFFIHSKIELNAIVS